MRSQHTYTITHKQPHTRTRTHAHTPTCTHTYTHAVTHTHMHTQAHMHTRTCTHTHTHTFTHMQPWYEHLEGQRHTLSDDEAKDKFLGVTWPAKLLRLADRQVAALEEDEARCVHVLFFFVRVFSMWACLC